jgi:hypothetical protein
VCAFLSAYLMLKGWSLMGDALSPLDRAGRRRGLHAWALPFSRSAPSSQAGIAASLAMLFVTQQQSQAASEDAVIGLVFTALFGARPVDGLAVADLGEHPDHRAWAISWPFRNEDVLQVAVIAAVVTLAR